jgi:hypothetical protein
MANPEFIKTYDAGAACTAYQIVKYTSTDYQVQPASASTDALAGVTTEIAAASGERVDVISLGVAYVKAGGTIAPGDPLTSDSNGAAIKAAPATGVNAQCIGRARYSGVSGDVIEVVLGGFILQG